MFLGQVGEKVPEDEEIVRKKLELKINRQYADIGKIPGIAVEENKRRKLIRDLGIEVPG
jgi:hypothetical protein